MAVSLRAALQIPQRMTELHIGRLCKQPHHDSHDRRRLARNETHATLNGVYFIASVRPMRDWATKIHVTWLIVTVTNLRSSACSTSPFRRKDQLSYLSACIYCGTWPQLSLLTAHNNPCYTTVKAYTTWPSFPPYDRVGPLNAPSPFPAHVSPEPVLHEMMAGAFRASLPPAEERKTPSPFHLNNSKDCTSTTSAPAPSPSVSRTSSGPEYFTYDLIPPGAWDSHVHIIEPQLYLLAPTVAYPPPSATLQQALAFEHSIKISNVVLVQPSIYGTDNSCLLTALRTLGPHRARGVVAFDPSTTSPPLLRHWHALGVRGARIDLMPAGNSVAPIPDRNFKHLLFAYADAIRPLGWVLQLHIPMCMVPLVEELLPHLRITIAFDHFAAPNLIQAKPQPPDGPISLNAMPGFTSLCRILSNQSCRAFIKFSGAYRFVTSIHQGRALHAMARELIRVASARVIWASEWPHTRFEGFDARQYLADCIDWCGGDEVLKKRLFKENAENLWGIESDTKSSKRLSPMDSKRKAGDDAGLDSDVSEAKRLLSQLYDGVR